jgi:hypothetical protein
MKNFNFIIKAGLLILYAVMAIFFITSGHDPGLIILPAIMTALEIKDAKTILLDVNDDIFKKADAENRNMTDKENQTIQENLRKLAELELKLQSETFKLDQGKPIAPKMIVGENREKFSLFKAINEMVEHRNFHDQARNIFTLGKQDFRKAGVTATGDIVIPGSLDPEMRDLLMPEFRYALRPEKRADILAGTQYQGQEIVGEDKLSIIPPLAAALIFSRAGVTFFPNCIGNVSMPSYAGTTVLWKGEIVAADDGAGAFAEVEFGPKRLTAKMLISKTFLVQDAVGAEALLLSNIRDATARKLESTVMGILIGSATQPQGMGYKITTGADTKANSVVPTLANVIALETAVDVSNALQGNLAYITNGGGRGILKGIPLVATYGDKMLLEGNQMNGYPVLVSNSASAIAGDDDTGDLVVFGNWKDLCITQWGGYDITLDVFTPAETNQVKIVINAYFDAKGLHGALATDVHGVTQSDYYAHSFASMAIKAS